MNDFNRIEVLNHGYVELIDCMGSDHRVVNSAKVSFAGQIDEKEPLDQRSINLIKYLLRNQHTSVFESVIFQFRMRLPIFVMRQLVRHRTARLNEESARYSILRDDCYVPEIDRMQRNSAFNKQGSSGTLDDVIGNNIIDSMVEEQEKAFAKYHSYLDDELAKELSRINLPVSTYTEIYWQMDLNNLFRFLKLRLDHHAQYEIRVYAQAIFDLIKHKVPVCCAAFEEYMLNAVSMTQEELAIFGKLSQPDTFDLVDTGILNLSRSEQHDFWVKINRLDLESKLEILLKLDANNE